MNSYLETRPNLDELDFQHSILNSMSKSNIFEMPNLIFYGSPSSGKTTKIYAFLSSLLNTKDIYDTKSALYEEDRKEINYTYSDYHLEFSPFDLESYQKNFIQGFLKEYVQTMNIGLDIPKIVIIKNADLLSYDSQKSLIYMMEAYSQTSRFIIEVRYLDKISTFLLSRCLTVRIPYPRLDQIKLAFKKMALNNYNRDLTEEEWNTVIEYSRDLNYNLKHINGLIRCYLTTGEWLNLSYLQKCDELYGLIKKYRTLNNGDLERIREVIQELYIFLTPMDDVLIYIYKKLTNDYVDNTNLCMDIIKITGYHDNLMANGNKKTIHIESYVINIIQKLMENDMVQKSTKKTKKK